jgi:hypothetical protein
MPSLPVSHTGISYLPLSLNNVLIFVSLVKNLVSVGKLTRDSSMSIEFGPFGLFVMDLRARMVILRCDSSDDLYPFYCPVHLL